MSTETVTKVVVESAEAVLGLHWFVARDFTVKDEGLEIEIITPGIKTKFDWSDPRSRDHHLVTPTNYQKAFDEGRADIYRACEWGQIRRTYDNPDGPIVARRPAMVYQGIYARPDSPFNAPITLAGHGESNRDENSTRSRGIPRTLRPGQPRAGLGRDPRRYGDPGLCLQETQQRRICFFIGERRAGRAHRALFVHRLQSGDRHSLARLRGEDGTRFTPYELVLMATMGGARALDMEDQIGSLEVGKKADIVIVDTDAANMQPVYDPYATLVFSAYPGNVRTTIVNGTIVVRDGILQTADLAAHGKEWKLLTERVAEFAKTLE